MAEPNEIAEGGKEAAPAVKSELPHVESPSISPAESKPSESVAAPAAAPEPVKPAPFAAAPEPAAEAKPHVVPDWKAKLLAIPQIKLPGVTISRRARRNISLAATVMIAACLGAAVGAALDKRQTAQAPAPQRDALLEENQSMQKSIARLSKDLSALRTSIDATKGSIEAATKDSKSQIAKLADRLDKSPDITASISKPATIATPVDPTPIPVARPQTAERAPVVQGWAIREVQNGMAWVEYRGDLYRAAPGIPLPGLGQVEAIKRDGNQWVVVTPKGIITSGDTTARAERPRPYYPPYYRPY
jgi:hypothetical protein